MPVASVARVAPRSVVFRWRKTRYFKAKSDTETVSQMDGNTGSFQTKSNRTVRQQIQNNGFGESFKFM